VKVNLDKEARVNYVLPAEFSKVAALDFQGLAADFQLLQGIFFIGEKIERSELIDTADWDYFTRIIKVVIKLDPYFYDTYHLATGMLTWGSGRYQDAIDILEMARQFNPDDYRFPYHIGFIYFYFLNDAQKGAQYFELASRVPGAPPILASLASRLAYYKGNYKFAIDLLQYHQRKYFKSLGSKIESPALPAGIIKYKTQTGMWHIINFAIYQENGLCNIVFIERNIDGFKEVNLTLEERESIKYAIIL
jgi:tetratricopeptide (TPR) repeat protein